MSNFFLEICTIILPKFAGVWEQRIILHFYNNAVENKQAAIAAK